MNSTDKEPAVLTMLDACPLLQVFDMPTSLAFYRDLLGFAVTQCAPEGASDDRFGWAWLQHGNVNLMLNTAYDPTEVRPPQPDERRAAAHGDTSIFIACPDVDAAYRYLRERDVAVSPPTTASYGMKQLHVVDPDGFDLCFQWPVEA